MSSLSAAERRKAWTAATRRRNEIINIAKHRMAQGGTIDEWAIVFALAQTLASAPAGRYRIKGHFVTYHGLDGVSLSRSVRETGLGQFGCDDDLIVRALAKVKPGPAMGSDTAGRLLKLTAEERDLLSIRTIEATDESRADREARRREERRLRDADRKRRARAGLHQPRSEWLAGKLTASKPWLELGISRRTFERRKQTVAGLSAATYATVAGLSVSRVCPPTYVINGCADTPATAVDDTALASSLQRSDSSTCPSRGADVASRPEGLIGGSRNAQSVSDKIPTSQPAVALLESPSTRAAIEPDPVEIAVLTELGRGNLSIGREIGGFVPTDALDRLLDHARQLGIAACKSEILNVRGLGFARLRAAGRASA